MKVGGKTCGVKLLDSFPYANDERKNYRWSARLRVIQREFVTAYGLGFF